MKPDYRVISIHRPCQRCGIVASSRFVQDMKGHDQPLAWFCTRCGHKNPVDKPLDIRPVPKQRR